ncbi:hypothetical protein PG997_006428 [Apiospora hydei]|uniref:Uncharacterized protein n=1 Tax=Apiospora hydei TaxID=1337664 RepID=A0ABR1WNR4_9PEZI
MPGLTQIMGAGHIVPVAGIAPWAGGAAMGMPCGQQGSFAAAPPWAGMAGGDMPAAGMCPAGAAGIAPPWLGGAMPAPPPAAGIPPAGISPPMGGGAIPPPVRFFIDLPAGMAAPGACPEAPQGTHCIGGAGAPVAQEATAIQTVLTAICCAAGCAPAGGAAALPPIGGMAPPGAGIPPPVASARGSIFERASRYFIVNTFGVGRVNVERKKKWRIVGSGRERAAVVDPPTMNPLLLTAVYMRFETQKRQDGRQSKGPENPWCVSKVVVVEIYESPRCDSWK